MQLISHQRNSASVRDKASATTIFASMDGEKRPADLASDNKRRNESSSFKPTSNTGYPNWSYPSRPPGDGSNQNNPHVSQRTSSASSFNYPSEASVSPSPPHRHEGGGMFDKLISLKKNNPNVKIVFPVSSSNGAGAFTQTTLPKQSTWGDQDFVQMPYDPCNTKIQVHRESLDKAQVKKWAIINNELAKLKSLIASSDFDEKLRQSVSQYNSKYGKSSFNLLTDSQISLKSQFEFIAEEAAKIENNFPFGIPVLKSGRTSKVTTIFLNQKQICSILANAFLCTFPKREQAQGKLPEINFHELYHGTFGSNEAEKKIEKLKCILHYFERMRKIKGNGNILSFERRSLSFSDEPNWEYCNLNKMSYVKVFGIEGIESAKDCLQVDFANQFIGGGVIGRGMVMEEVRFSICPELIVARLFTEKLEKDEVLIIKGCEQFCKYRGYGNTFQYAGDFVDDTKLDEYGRRKTEIVAMDAYNFSEQDPRKQFGSHLVKRELNKSYCAFAPQRHQEITPVATGNWGCGAFKGDPQLKFIIQWMAASVAGRELHYYTGDAEQRQEIINIVKILGRKDVSIKKLFYAIEDYYRREIEYSFSKSSKSLFTFFERNQKW